jgi:hypothetical protein
VYGILGLIISAVISWLSGRLQYLEAAEVEAQRKQALDPLATEAPPAPSVTIAATTPQTPLPTSTDAT